MTRMGRLFRRNFDRVPKDRSEEVIIRAKRLKRVRLKGKLEGKTKVIGATEEEIQDVKQGLDTNIIKGKKERESKKQLRRLGFLA